MLIVTPEYVTEVTAPTYEPVSLAEAKAHLRVDIPDEDILIAALIVAARQRCELYTNRAFVQRTVRADIDCFADEIQLPYTPVASITSVKYWNTSSPTVLTTLASNVYGLSRNRVIRLYGKEWEDTYPKEGAVQITYVAGYASTSSPQYPPSDVPQAVKQAMYLYIGDMYEHREAQFLSTAPIENQTACHLLDFYRVYR
jgi:uncharacterized phiE125 gp8 family phage protein